MEIQTGSNTNFEPTELDWEQWLGNWTWRAVQCLVEATDFNPSPKWISQRLNITVEKSVEAIEGLLRLGCIQRDGHSYKVNTNWMQLTPTNLNRGRLLNAQSRIAPQLISKLTSDDAFTSQFILADKELIKKYAPKFMSLFKEMNDEGLASKRNEVVAAQISFVQLTSEKEAGGLQ